jgi:hypothetical protein
MGSIRYFSGSLHVFMEPGACSNARGSLRLRSLRLCSGSTTGPSHDHWFLPNSWLEVSQYMIHPMDRPAPRGEDGHITMNHNKPGGKRHEASDPHLNRRDFLYPQRPLAAYGCIQCLSHQNTPFPLLTSWPPPCTMEWFLMRPAVKRNGEGSEQVLTPDQHTLQEKRALPEHRKRLG